MNTLNRHSKPLVKIAVTLFLLIFFQSIAISQNDARFSQLSLEKGVALNLTFDMLQDSEGYLWFGTMYGLVRYDGLNYKTFTYDPENPESISFDDVISLFEDSNGNLWIGTWGGAA